MPRKTPLLIVALVLTGCAKLIVTPVPQVGRVPAEGVFYALPKTVLRIRVKVDRTVPTAAPFARFAAIFAADGQPVCKDPECTQEKQHVFSLQEGATFTTYGEPDPENVYLVKFTGGRAIDQTVSMSWTDTGLLAMASASVTNRSSEIATSGLKLVAGLGTKLHYGLVQATDRAPWSCPTPGSADSWVLPILQDQDAKENELTAHYCALAKDVRDDTAQFARARDEKPLGLAMKQYKARIQPLITAREALLTGGKQTMEPTALLTKVEAVIDLQLHALYLGTKKVETWDGSIDVRSIDPTHSTTPLRIDPAAGICIVDAEPAPDCKPIPAQFALPSEKCQRAPRVALAISYWPAQESQLFSRIKKNTIPVDEESEHSFRYRVPAQVKAELQTDEKVYGAGVFSVAQLGQRVSLPARRSSKTLSYDLTFLEATGALKSFKLGSTGGLDAATIDAITAAGGGVVDARNAARKAAEISVDELTILTRQNNLLKLRDEICTIQKKYGLLCTVAPE